MSVRISVRSRGENNPSARRRSEACPSPHHKQFVSSDLCVIVLTCSAEMPMTGSREGELQTSAIFGVMTESPWLMGSMMGNMVENRTARALMDDSLLGDSGIMASGLVCKGDGVISIHQALR